MILVTGGCCSGKSEFAEKLVTSKGTQEKEHQYLYIATAKITDPQMGERVLKHRMRRDSRWDNYEAADGTSLQRLISFLKAHKEDNHYEGVLVDSVTTLATNLLLETVEEPEGEDASYENVDYEMASDYILGELQLFCGIAKEYPMVFVTDEIGLGVVPESTLGRNFRDILGKANQYLASLCSEVYFVVSGIPVRIKDEQNTEDKSAKIHGNEK